MEQKNTWDVLSKIDCKDKVEKKNNLTYLSWAWAWGIVKAHFPDANYKVEQFEGKPYLHDDILGYLVKTEVTIQGETIPMHLPIMDGANKAQRSEAYTYEVNKYEWVNGRKQVTGKEKKVVEAATMFDINTAIMRCLTKNLALFGLGHYIYAGEDLPQDYATEEKPKEKVTAPKIQSAPSDLIQRITAELAKVTDEKSLIDLSATTDGKAALTYPELKQLFTAKRLQFKPKK